MNFYEMLCLLEDNKNKILHEQDQKTQELKNKILNAVDVWVKQVLDMLKNPSNNAKMGLWDRFKGGVQNLWYGRNNEKNPNYWRNRYGDDLGTAKESYIYINLQNYNEIKNLINNLENRIITLRESDFDNLKIVQMVNQAGNQLKKMLSDILDSFSCDPNDPSPKNPPGDASRSNSASVANSAGDSNEKNEPSPDGPSDGSSGSGTSASEDGLDSPTEPQDPDEKQGMIDVISKIPPISKDSEKYVDIMYKNNIKNAKELDRISKEIYGKIKSKLESVGKQVPEYEQLLVQIIYLISVKVEYEEASTMKDLIAYWIVGALDLTNYFQDKNRLLDQNTGKNKDFMDVVSHAKKVLGEV